MTPLLSTRHPWHVRFGESPPPAALPRDYDIVRVSVGLGVAAIDTMIDSGDRVGPLLCCMDHRMLLVPVQPGTAHRWGASHSECSAGSALWCRAYGARSACRSRLWLVPLEAPESATTEPDVLHDRLSLMRARMRDISRQPQAALRDREACHV